ncbi:MAG: cyclic nucleotide-binding domain-containing protein [Mariprofundaceae bacterium]|nr:cyclic nucleotide-binding domain-containing protein [Mariprofundaceae bacterium]
MSIVHYQAQARESIMRGDLPAAATAFGELARLQPTNMEFCLMAADLSDQTGDAETSADWYAHAARFYVDKKNIGQAVLMIKHYQRLRPHEQRLCRQLYSCCRHECSNNSSPCLPLLADDDQLKVSLRHHNLFALISDHAFDDLLPQIQVKTYQDGELIARSGDTADALYLIAKGGILPHVDDYDQAYDLSPIVEGGVCGEVPFLTGGEERTADLIAIGVTELAVVPYDVLKNITASYPKVMCELDAFYQGHVLERQLALTQFFDVLTDEERHEVSAQLETVHLSGGENLFTQDESTPLDMYVVRSGWLAVNVNINGYEHLVYTAKCGNVLGDIGVLEKVRRFSVRAVSESIVMRWPEAKYRAFYAAHDDLRYRVADRMLAYQQAISDLRAGQKPTAIEDAMNQRALLRGVYSD